jgi:Plasmid pRiA4b ORF-3-like protein
MPEPAQGALPCVYQLRIVLRGISPLIWRRLLVRADDSIADLHTALQITFGWDGSHLHRFVIHGREYGHDSSLDPHEVRLRDLGLRVGERFTYEYDFTDYWVNDIRLEAILEPRPGRRYPVLTGGRRSAPPENCGGAWEFLQLREQHTGAPVKLLRMFGELLDADRGQRIDEILGDRYEQFLELCRWTLIDRFDRRAANRQLHNRARGMG